MALLGGSFTVGCLRNTTPALRQSFKPWHLVATFDIKESVKRTSSVSPLAAKSASQTVYDNVVIKIINSVNNTLRK